MKTADYQGIEKVIAALDEKRRESSDVEEMAARVGGSREDLAALFQRWAGVDPGRFLQSLTLSQTRKRLTEVENLLAGSRPQQVSGASSHLEGTCRLRFLPSGQGKGLGLTISHGLYPSPFGDCLLAMTGREICHLSFVDPGQWPAHLEELRHNWPQATIIAGNGQDGRRMVERIFMSTEVNPLDSFLLLLPGTAFQFRVWQALLAVPRGALISYQGLAAYMGHPTACRAVASAVAANPVGYLIPCHRVIRKSGEIHHYRWGSSRKKAMLGWEACQL
ncbi:MAG: methylated-DNA--[protein]-cysteine S-methyltransferase [Desulfocapsaceae bacterium]|nr:methylated-DNA--[protein]-cysteine S-methyltransferase [Desulfocapsaceae bacterium]